MNRLKRPLLWAALLAIILLTVLSIYGAFLGADRAQVFFNSLPATVYWFGLAALLIAGFALFPRLIRVPSLLMMHLGCILILAGGMWGSASGQQLQARLLGRKQIFKGQMPILEGTAENRVRVGDSDETPELPFSIRLRDFRMEYYPVGTVFIQSRSGKRWKLRGRPGETLSLGDDLGRVTVERTFRNFKMSLEGDQRVATDAPGDGNPAVEIQVTKPDGTTTTRYVFANFPGHPRAGDPLTMSYERMVRDYVSDLEVIKEGRVVREKSIEVNHPLAYGGYHFYQHSYGQNEFGDYTVLMVVSDSGLRAVFIGYGLLIAGVCWHFWFRRLLAAWRDRIVAQAAAAKKGGADGR
jgi:hypothetical protein